jgi:tripartite-type tricarboxylate transporter receptor subunit TctC
LLARAARAQAWRAVRACYLPGRSGGSIDAVTRLVAGRLAGWRQQVVENRTGGSNNIAAEAVALRARRLHRAAAPASLMAGLLFPARRYDPVADFAGLARRHLSTSWWCRTPRPRIRSKFIAHAKANPGKIRRVRRPWLVAPSRRLVFKRMTGSR